MRLVFMWFLLLVGLGATAQSAQIRGKVTDEKSGEALPFVNVSLPELERGTTTDLDGNFEIKGLPNGNYNLIISYIGYAPKKFPELLISSAKPVVLNVALAPSVNELAEVTVTVSAFEEQKENPVSLRALGIAELERNPGGNRDVSKVIQSLPGVGQGVSFRNDLIIRGGGPSENAFFIDDVETPNFNHFATQGASGGPVGMIDVNYVQSIDLATSAFPVYVQDALSSALMVKYREPRDDQVGYRLTLGASDLAFGAEGPISEKVKFLASYRRSYLQFLFQGLGLPFLPTYNDLQYKIIYRPNSDHTLYLNFLGALDKSRLNRMENPDESQAYILKYLPEDDQWSYTQGLVWKYRRNNGFYRTVLSRNMLRNQSEKYEGNDRETGLQTLDFQSDEAENRARVERVIFGEKGKWFFGISGNAYKFSINQNQVIPVDSSLVYTSNSANLSGIRYSAYGQYERKFFGERLLLQTGLRYAGDSYNSEMQGGLDNFLPYASARFNLSSQWAFNAGFGLYQQAPSYTSLGYAENGVLVNRSSLDFIKSRHLIAGFSYYTRKDGLFSVEAFDKAYTRYPVSIEKGIVLANLGGDFGVVGAESLRSNGRGRARGVEFLYQQKSFKGFFGIFAYTFLVSEFSAEGDELKPSSWDARHTISATAGKRFKNGWEIGSKWRFSSGNPYTPYDLNQSSYQQVYNINPLGVLDYSRLNEERFPVFSQVDLRVDKKWFFEKANLNLYFDVQNLLGSTSFTRPILLPVRDASGNPVTDPNNPEKYLLRVVENGSTTVLPTLGLIFEF